MRRISQYRLDWIRQIKQEINLLDDGTCTLLGRFVPGMEPDCVLHFSNFPAAVKFVINAVLSVG